MTAADRAAATATAAEIIGRGALGHRGQWDTDGELLVSPRTPEETAALLAVLEVHAVHDRDSVTGDERYRDRRATTTGARLPVRVSTILGETDPDPAQYPATAPVAQVRTHWYPAGDGVDSSWHAVYADGRYVGDYLYDGEAVAPDDRRIGRYATVTAAAAALAAATADHTAM